MRTPSKKIILMLVIVALIGTIAYFFIGKTKKETYTSPAIVSAAQSAVLAKDSDNDGLKDWEEQLWKTDPNNPDTDSDGTPDGLEIKQGRNPLVAGPNDKLDTDTVTNKINTITEGDLTETDKFSRELFVRIIAAKNANTPPTEADLQNFLNMTINQETENQKMKNFTAGDFQVDKAETAETIKAYGNTIADILTKKPPNKLEYEIITVERAEKNNDPNELKKLIPLAAEYGRIQKDLLNVVVPESALPFHIALTNGASGMNYSITGLQYVMTDPIKSLPGISSYDSNSQNFTTSVRQFKSYFDGAGIVFEKGDKGFKFFGGL